MVFTHTKRDSTNKLFNIKISIFLNYFLNRKKKKKKISIFLNYFLNKKKKKKRIQYLFKQYFINT